MLTNDVPGERRGGHFPIISPRKHLPAAFPQFIEPSSISCLCIYDVTDGASFSLYPSPRLAKVTGTGLGESPVGSAVDNKAAACWEDVKNTNQMFDPLVVI